MRKTSELLEVLLDNMDKFDNCLCDLSRDLQISDTITSEENAKIDDYFHNYFISNNRYYPFLFPINEKEPRIRWLKTHIVGCKSIGN